MKFTMPLTFEIDPAEWAREYDLSGVSEALADIVRLLTEAGQEGAVAAAIEAQWPMMREAATITVGPIAVGSIDIPSS